MPHRVGERIDVDQNGPRTGPLDRGNRGDGRVGGGDHRLSRSDAGDTQGQFDRVGATGDADGLFDAEIRGELSFKCGHLFAQHVSAAGQHAGNGRVDFRSLGSVGVPGLACGMRGASLMRSTIMVQIGPEEIERLTEPLPKRNSRLPAERAANQRIVGIIIADVDPLAIGGKLLSAGGRCR